MTLLNCTKEELMYIINHIAGRIGLQNKDYYIKNALIQVEYMREQKQLDKAEEYNKLAANKRKEYTNLMKQYIGEKIQNIPLDVLKKATDLLKEANNADKEYDKIIKGVIKNE